MTDVESIPKVGPSSTNSNASFAFARKCFGDCLRDHAQCQTGKSPPTYPTRLLHIQKGDDTWDGDNIAARLIITNESKPTRPYCSLSHCWGKLQIFKLLKSNMESMKRGIDLKSLPQSFKDAIRMACSLGIQYIWIDSLCIIQDSAADWEREASRMTMVYHWATLNIAATKAVDGSEGLFTTRNWSNLFAVVTMKQNHKMRGFHIIREDYWERTVNDAPLNQRAWVVQERMLSSKTLHFTRDQLIWDCNEMLRFESSELELAAWTSRYSRSLGPKRNYHYLNIEQHGGDADDEWLVAMRKYSTSSLTFRTDKVIALLGLIGHFEQILGNTHYAGFWRESMVYHLSWYTNQAPTASPVARNGCAPSWSWLSFDGQVDVPSAGEFNHKYQNRIQLAEVLSVNIAQYTERGGYVYEGDLVLRAAMTPLVFNEEENSFTLPGQISAPFISEETKISCNLDYIITNTEQTAKFFFIPLWAALAASRTLEFNDHCEIQGLVIRTKQQEHATYERCAHGCLITNLTAPLEGLNTYFQAVEAARLCRQNNHKDDHSMVGGTVKLV